VYLRTLTDLKAEGLAALAQLVGAGVVPRSLPDEGGKRSGHQGAVGSAAEDTLLCDVDQPLCRALGYRIFRRMI